MFTGLIEEVGYVRKIRKSSNEINITISCKKILEDAILGDSICVNGICLTIVNKNKDEFSANISYETFNITTFNKYKIGDEVNLERAMKIDGRFGGHIVSGHVDGVGKVDSIKKINNSYELSVKVSNNIINKCVEKGSITIDGISLTIFKVKENSFKVAIIPHTFLNTTLKNKRIGDLINIENDVLGKYIEKKLENSLESKGSNITIKLLGENGFL